MDGKTNALNGNGTGLTYSVKQTGTGGAAGVWQYTAPAGKKIANAVLTHYAGDGLLTYDAKDRSLRLAVSSAAQGSWGAIVDYTSSIIEATDTYLKFGPYTNPNGNVIAPNPSTVAVISLY